MTQAPAQLPFAPRPVSTELLSSWLLRVASANLITLRELLEGFEEHYGRVLTNVPIDYGISEAAVAAFSQFCRVAPRTIRMLDLRQHACWLTPSALLRFQNVDWRCRRYCSKRVRYAFCPSCLANQRVIHIPWDWGISNLVRCAVHKGPLLDGCATCGEADPLTFAAEDVRCRSCSSIIFQNMEDHRHSGHAVEDAYRAVLSGAASTMLLHKTTDREFRRFVEGMVEFLIDVLGPCSRSWPDRADSFSRQDILDIIAALVLNAASNSNPSVRRRHGRQGVRLWATLLSVIPEHRGTLLEKTSLWWPMALRRRFLSGLHYRYRKRWPYTPYRAATQFRKPVLRAEIAGVFGLADRQHRLISTTQLPSVLSGV